MKKVISGSRFLGQMFAIGAIQSILMNGAGSNVRTLSLIFVVGLICYLITLKQRTNAFKKGNILFGIYIFGILLLFINPILTMLVNGIIVLALIFMNSDKKQNTRQIEF